MNAVNNVTIQLMQVTGSTALLCVKSVKGICILII